MPTTMGNLAKLRYSHIDMIDFIIAHPEVTQNDLAARYGYSASWVSNIMASDAWQAQFAKRRGELVDPGLAHTVDERMRALVLRSQERLMEKLNQAVVSDNTILKALELGAKSIGMGQEKTPPAAPNDALERLANRLIDLQSSVRKGHTYENEVPQVG